MRELPKIFLDKLRQRKRLGHLREKPLACEGIKVDFYSNDYLGFARDAKLTEKAKALLGQASHQNGSGSARLIAGTHAVHQHLEQRLKTFHNAEDALLFNSGYDANVGLFAALGHRRATFVYDALIHASVRDGMAMGHAQNQSFKHNDVNDLENKLQKAQGTVFVAVEALYSMDGDVAPLKEMVALCQKYRARLIVDEAHSGGVMGTGGVGLTQAHGLEKSVFARVHTFGKALGGHGAVVLGSSALVSYLVNFARPFIYTTAMPPHTAAFLSVAYDALKENHAMLAQKMTTNIDFFREQIQKNNLSAFFTDNKTHIQTLRCSSGEEAIFIAQSFIKEGFGVKAILPPTVPKSQERVRICLHTYNTKTAILNFFKMLCNIKENHSSSY